MNDILRVRQVGFIEACSAIVLFFIAMPLKYLADMKLAVTYVGMIHGLLWLGYILVLLFAFNRKKLSGKWFAILFVASLIPFGPFLFDRKLKNLQTPRPGEPGA